MRTPATRGTAVIHVVPQAGTDVLREVFELAAHATSAAQARHRALAWLCRHSVRRPAADTAVLIVSELVTNALVHGGGDVITCALWLRDGLLRIAVTDRGTGGTEPVVRQAAAEDVSGRGLLLVHTLSEEWGVTAAHPRGRTVWAVLPAHE